MQSNSINFNFGHLSAKYQGYSLTFWPNMPHFHHFSVCNQNQSISILVICRQNTKVIALLFGQKCLIFITFQCAIKLNQFQFWSFLGKLPRLCPYLLPKMPHFHHFSVCNQNQSTSILVIFRQNTKVIALLFGQKCLIFITFQCTIKSINVNSYFSANYQGYSLTVAKNASFSSLFSVQSNSINQFQFWSFSSAKYQGYSLTFWPKMPHFHVQSNSINFTKVIALLFGQKCLIFITFQCAIKLNQFQFWSFLGKLPRLFPYLLAKNASFSSLFSVQSKSIHVNFGHFSAKYQGYSLTFWPKMPHFHHFSVYNQNQSISILVIFRQTTKGIALLFGQKCLIFITFQCAIKLNQFQFWSFIGKIPRL